MRKIVLVGVCPSGLAGTWADHARMEPAPRFPIPMYSKWFSEYHKMHSDVQINYQPIGSGGGIRQVTAGTVDFGASDMPMTDKQLQEAKTKDSEYSDRAGRGRAGLQHSRRHRGSEVHAGSAGGNFPGQDLQME